LTQIWDASFDWGLSLSLGEQVVVGGWRWVLLVARW